MSGLVTVKWWLRCLVLIVMVISVLRVGNVLRELNLMKEKKW